MSLADSVRKEMGSAMLPDWFGKEMVSAIRSNGGKVTLICAGHISKVSTFAYPLKYENAIYAWAAENGFHAFPYCNGHGVPGIRITL